MAEASSDKPDQPARPEPRRPEDAAVRLNEILSSPIEDPFAPEPKPASAPAPGASGRPTSESAATAAPAADSPATQSTSPHHNVGAPDVGALAPDPTPPDVGTPDPSVSAERPPPANHTEAAKALPADFAAWQGAQPEPRESARATAVPAEPEPAPSGASPSLAEQQTGPAVAAPPRSDASGPEVISKVRRLMLISTVLTALAIAAVLGIIGYRVFTSAGTQRAPNQATLTLPQGARIVQTAIAADRLVLTLEVGGGLEIRTYDLRTLKPLGQLNFSRVP